MTPATWQPAEAGLALPGPYPSLSLLAGKGILYLFGTNTRREAQLYRSLDGGEGWQMADGWPPAGAGPVAPRPAAACGLGWPAAA